MSLHYGSSRARELDLKKEKDAAFKSTYRRYIESEAQEHAREGEAKAEEEEVVEQQQKKVVHQDKPIPDHQDPHYCTFFSGLGVQNHEDTWRCHGSVRKYSARST